ncbi:MAG: hypothetical protein V8R61_02815 [Enterocloster sp.]
MWIRSCGVTAGEYLRRRGFYPEDDIEDYYKDGYAVMDVTFEEGDTAKRTSRAIDEMKSHYRG